MTSPSGTCSEVSQSNMNELLPSPSRPLPVQRRIVDLLEHLDSHLANLDAELVRATMRDSLVGRCSGTAGRHAERDVTLGQGVRLSGRPIQWKAKMSRRDPGPVCSRGLVHTTLRPSGGTSTISEETYVRGSAYSTTRTSIVMVRRVKTCGRDGKRDLPTAEIDASRFPLSSSCGTADHPRSCDFTCSLRRVPAIRH